MPAQGEIYYADTGNGGRRPVLVVSVDRLNNGNYVVVVPFTSSQFDKRSTLPTCVPFHAGDFGLPKDCVAQADAIGQLDIRDLDLDSGRLGLLDDVVMRSVIKAIGEVIGADCEPV